MINESKIIGAVISSQAFFWDKTSNSFLADISEVPQVLRQLWNDSMDLGFEMVSVRTGHRVPFTLSRAERDGEGDMSCWIFTNPAFPGLKVVVYND